MKWEDIFLRFVHDSVNSAKLFREKQFLLKIFRISKVYVARRKCATETRCTSGYCMFSQPWTACGAPVNPRCQQCVLVSDEISQLMTCYYSRYVTLLL